MRFFVNLFVGFLIFFVVSCSGDFSRLDSFQSSRTNFSPASSSGSDYITSSETSPVFSQPLDSIETSGSSSGSTFGSSSLDVSSGSSSSSSIPDYAPDYASVSSSNAGELPASVEATVSSISGSSSSPEIIDTADAIEVTTSPESPSSSVSVVGDADDVGVPRRRHGSASDSISASGSDSSVIEVASVASSTPVVTSSASASDGLFRWPVEGRIIGNFGERTELGVNDGIDISAPEGTPVKAVEGGTVVYSGDELSDFGNLILLSHSDGWVSAYAHSSENRVNRGDTVTRGQVIALSGKTGKATTPKLHFELRRDSRPVDPVQYLER